MPFNPSFNTVSQFSHVGWGFLLVTVLALVLHVPLMYAGDAVVIAAAGKEYWDCHGGENPATAGDSWEDFFFWCVGVGLATVVLAAAR